MFAVVTGGSGSGKSEYAEGLAVRLEPGKKTSGLESRCAGYPF